MTAENWRAVWTVLRYGFRQQWQVSGYWRIVRAVMIVVFVIRARHGTYWHY